MLAKSFVPNSVVISGVGESSALVAAVPLARGKIAQGGKPTAYVCEQSRCELPTSDPAVFAKQLAKIAVPAE